jgi:hypothetical protein
MLVIREHFDELGLDFGDLAPEELTPKAVHDAATKQLEQDFGSAFLEQLQQQPMSRGEEVRRVAFNADETLLLCATSGGVRVYEWERINEHSDSILLPSFAADAIPTTVESDAMSMTMAYTYAMAHDEANQLLLFAGLEGEIRFLDLRSGKNGSLLEIPGRPAILDMCLNSDNTALCCVCQPSFFENRNRKPPLLLQIWNYATLQREAAESHTS